MKYASEAARREAARQVIADMLSDLRAHKAQQAKKAA